MRRKKRDLTPQDPRGSERQLPVAAVIVTWNSSETIEDCLSSCQGAGVSEIIVVDNGSTDDTADRVRRCCPGADLILWQSNRGFAAGCNAGIEATRAPYVLLLNDDARLSSDYVRVLLTALEADRGAASAVGKLLLDSRRGAARGHRIDSTGIVLRRYALSPLDRGHGEPDHGQYDRPQEIFGPSAAATLYRRRALRSLGPEVFDASLFAYYEDVDLAWRLRALGWRHLYRPAAVGWHARRGPDAKPSALAARAFVNRYVVWLKNESPLRFSLYAPVALPWEAVRLMRRKQMWSALTRELGGAPRRLAQALRQRLRG